MRSFKIQCLLCIALAMGACAQTHAPISLDTRMWEDYAVDVLDYEVSFKLPPEGEITRLTGLSYLDGDAGVLFCVFDRWRGFGGSRGIGQFYVSLSIRQALSGLDDVGGPMERVVRSIDAKSRVPLDFEERAINGREWSFYRSQTVLISDGQLHWLGDRHANYVTTFAGQYYLDLHGHFSGKSLDDIQWYESRQEILRMVAESIRIVRKR